MVPPYYMSEEHIVLFTPLRFTPLITVTFSDYNICGACMWMFVTAERWSVTFLLILMINTKSQLEPKPEKSKLTFA